MTPTKLSAVSGSGTFGGTATLTSTLTASDLPLAGRTVTFTLSEGVKVRTLGTAMTNGSGVATLTGVGLARLSAGTYAGAVGASFAGDSTYGASSATGTLVVNTPPTLFIIREQPLFLRKNNIAFQALQSARAKRLRDCPSGIFFSSAIDISGGLFSCPRQTCRGI